MAPPSATPDQRPARNGRRAAIHYARKAPLMDPSPALKAAPTRPPVRRKRRQYHRTTDAAGNPLIHMPLSGGAVCVLDAPDFDRLAALGVTDRWHFNDDGKGNAYVRVMLRRPAGNLVMVARLILEAPKGQVIRYANKNPLDLRRVNLTLDNGFSKQRENIVKSGVDHSTEADF